MNLNIIIPTGRQKNLERLLDSLFKHEPRLSWDRVIAIGDNYSPTWATMVYGAKSVNSMRPDSQPFNIAKNMNNGLRMMPSDGHILICGDDVEFVQNRGLEALSEVADRPGMGIVSAAIHGRGGAYQKESLVKASKDGFIRAPCKDMASILWMTCAVITRPCYDVLGPFDESSTGYSFEDSDYCMKADRAGFVVGTTAACTVRHVDGSVYARNPAAFPGLFKKGVEDFKKKWDSQ